MRGGALYCWGDGLFGAIGQASGNMDQPTPVQVGTETGWTAVSAGDIHACGLRMGRAYCWGYNERGESAVETKSIVVYTPTQVGSESDWSAIAAGDQSSCGVRGGALYCWGSNQGAGIALPLQLEPAKVEVP